MYNNCLQLTVKSVTFFAKQKNAPLFTPAEAGVRAMKTILLIIFLLGTMSCSIYGTTYERNAQKQKDEEISNKIVEEAGGYKPQDYENCPEGTKIREFGDGYICRESGLRQNDGYLLMSFISMFLLLLI